jgi:pyruvate/2-oxoglutarate/acetoin dehydrogenase E1 component
LTVRAELDLWHLYKQMLRSRLFEKAVTRVKGRRVCTDGTIPYACPLEDEVFPNTKRILEAARRLMKG